jgi:hypothetical protein
MQLTGSRLVLENSRVRRVFEIKDGVWRTRSLSRVDKSDKIKGESEEFLIQLLDDTRLRIDNYTPQGEPA